MCAKNKTKEGEGQFVPPPHQKKNKRPWINIQCVAPFSAFVWFALTESLSAWCSDSAFSLTEKYKNITNTPQFQFVEEESFLLLYKKY